MRSLLMIATAAALTGAADSEQVVPDLAQSAGVYRLPYAGGTRVSVFDDDRTHRPLGAVDLVGEPREGRAHRVVAAAAGVVMAIEDGYERQLSGRPAAECQNNYVWIAHANGEWTLYSHMRRGTTRAKARLKVGA